MNKLNKSNTLDQWIKYGERFLYTEFQDSWLLFLLVNAGDKLNDNAFKTIMTTINIIDIQKDLKMAKSYFLNYTNGNNFSQCLRAVTLFAKDGRKFFKYLKENRFSPKTAEYLDHIDMLYEAYELRKIVHNKATDSPEYLRYLELQKQINSDVKSYEKVSLAERKNNQNQLEIDLIK